MIFSLLVAKIAIVVMLMIIMAIIFMPYDYPEDCTCKKGTLCLHISPDCPYHKDWA